MRKLLFLLILYLFSSNIYAISRGTPQGAYVPYSNATQDVNLGSKNIYAGQGSFSTIWASGTVTVGTDDTVMFWKDQPDIGEFNGLKFGDNNWKIGIEQPSANDYRLRLRVPGDVSDRYFEVYDGANGRSILLLNMNTGNLTVLGTINNVEVDKSTSSFNIFVSSNIETGTQSIILSRSTMTFTEARAFIEVAPTGADVNLNLVDENDNNLLNGSLTISAGANWSSVITSTATIPRDGIVKLKIDQIGSTFPGNNLSVSIRYWKEVGQ